MHERDATQDDDARLALRLRERIEREGSITFSEWMSAALYDARDGYYCRRDLPRWGRAGDYRTSPERSPLFAATFARYFAALYEELSAPTSWTIVEAGAGAGDFAHGVLETLLAEHPNVYAATRYVIDEASEDARASVRARLATFGEHVAYQHLSELERPLQTAIIFSNELLDALPVHRLTMSAGRLMELRVGVSKAGDFVWVEQEATPHLCEYLKKAGVKLAEGQIVEVQLDAGKWYQHAASLLMQGFLVTVDYGAEARELYDPSSRPQGTLRAFHRHQLADNPLAHPGEQDLTTTVDWTRIKTIGEAAGLQTVSFERQDKFLLRAGLLDQLERMTATAQDEAAAIILRTSARSMILPDGMSQSFQVLVQKSIA
jgi:SAM-dependent MidA family methyltransferase